MPVAGVDSTMARLRAPLLASVAVIAAVDFIGLGTRFVNERSSLPEGTGAVAAPRRTPTTGVVVDVAVADRAELRTGFPRSRTTLPPAIGPRVSPPVVANGDGRGTPDAPTPISQADVAVPALGAHVGIGAGDDSCTTANLTVIGYGDCPAPEGAGPVIVATGGEPLPV